MTGSALRVGLAVVLTILVSVSPASAKLLRVFDAANLEENAAQLKSALGSLADETRSLAVLHSSDATHTANNEELTALSESLGEAGRVGKRAARAAGLADLTESEEFSPGRQVERFDALDWMASGPAGFRPRRQDLATPTRATQFAEVALFAPADAPLKDVQRFEALRRELSQRSARALLGGSIAALAQTSATMERSDAAARAVGAAETERLSVLSHQLVGLRTYEELAALRMEAALRLLTTALLKIDAEKSAR